MVGTAAEGAVALPPAQHQAALDAVIDPGQLSHAVAQQAVGVSSHLPQWVANDRKVDTRAPFAATSLLATCPPQRMNTSNKWLLRWPIGL